MRRIDREIRDPQGIREILESCQVMRIGFYDGQEVYVLPLNFGFEERQGQYTFYFHGAGEGRKIDLIRSHPHVGFETDTAYRIHEAEEACGYSAGFASIIGNGTMEMLPGPVEKKHGLRRIMAQVTGRDNWDFPEEMLKRTAVFCLKVEKMSAKAHE